ncbi:hypothetical protein JCM1840_003696 [Sporobolomyces johnsonii]
MLPRLLATQRIASSTRSAARPRTFLRSFAMSSPQAGPVESAIREKLTAALSPSVLEITNDSAAHRHHAPMRAVGGGSGETHFSVEVVSEQFEGLRAIARHRLVNAALKQEFEAGLHALAIKAKSPAEYEAAGGSV